MKSKLKNIIIFVVIFILAVVAYNAFFKKERDTAPLLTTTGLPAQLGGAPVDQSVIGRQFLTTLLNISNIRLDDSIFLSNEFNSLRDFSIPIIPPGDEGRLNPFAPFGAEELESLETPVTTEEATDITDTAVELNGSVDLSFLDAFKRFEWGEDESLLSNQTPRITQTTQTGFFRQEVVGLDPGTTYYFKAIVIIGGSAVSGDVLTFTTEE